MESPLTNTPASTQAKDTKTSSQSSKHNTTQNDPNMASKPQQKYAAPSTSTPVFSGKTGTTLSIERFPPHMALLKINDVLFPSTLIYRETPASVKTAFVTPHNQRSAIAICISLMRDMTHIANPAQHDDFELRITIPARHISEFRFTNCDPGPVSAFNDVMADEDNQLAILDITASAVRVMNARIPPLADSQLKHTAQAMIDDLCTRSMAGTPVQLSLCIERVRNKTLHRANNFYARVIQEQAMDPAAAWVKDSPRVQKLQMGNLLYQAARPSIPRQPAELVFEDRMAYLIPQIYGNLADAEFGDGAINDIKAATFRMVAIECVGATNLAPPTTEPTYKSSASAYIIFIDFTDVELVRPDVGTRMKIAFITEEGVDTGGSSGSSTDNREDGEAQQELAPKPAEPDAESSSDSELGDKDELGDEDQFDVLDEDYCKDNEDETAWFATVMEHSDITPPGYVTALLDRPRQRGYTGPKHLRPYVEGEISVVTLRTSESKESLAANLQAACHTDIKVSMDFSMQSFKDGVRCATDLWHENTAQNLRLREFLLCHYPQQSPLQQVNIHDLKGASTLDLSPGLNDTQREIHRALADTPEVTLIHGAFGTGKTNFLMNLALEVVSNPVDKIQVLYLVQSNQAVDDVALRLAAKAATCNLGHKQLVRAHTLITEKTEVYKYFDAQKQPTDRIATDSFLAEFSTLSYLTKLVHDQVNIRKRGDPRFVLKNMSLAQAMYNTLHQAEHGSDWVELFGWIAKYGREGFHNTDPERRTEIKLQLNNLLATTIQASDIIVCTVAAAAKVNLANNFRPHLVILDEAARVTEFQSLIPLALYEPRAFILAGDHKQMQPTVPSAYKDRDSNPFLNPFDNQVLLSLFERAILAGYPSHMFKIQHRCKGDIPGWVSKSFYFGQLVKSRLTPNDQRKLQSIRELGQSHFHTDRPTNQVGINIQDSLSTKENSGTSTINLAEAMHIIEDIKALRKDPVTKDMTIGVLTFYKAQARDLKVRCHELNVDIHALEGNEMLSPLSVKTVDAAQGTEYDIVLLSFANTKGTTFQGEPHRLLVAITRAKWLQVFYFNWSITDTSRKSERHNSALNELLEDLNKRGWISARASPPGILADTKVCRKCEQPGHVARNCPNGKIPICARCREHGDTDHAKGHTAAECTYYERLPRCRECNQLGHTRSACPQATCAHCNQTGHTKGACPLLPCNNCHRLGHTQNACKNPMTCTKCGGEGHSSNQCTALRTRRLLAQFQALDYKSDDSEDDGSQTQTDAEPQAQDGWGQPNQDNQDGWGQPNQSEYQPRLTIEPTHNEQESEPTTEPGHDEQDKEPAHDCNDW